MSNPCLRYVGMNSVQGQSALLYIDTEQDDGIEKNKG